jgi:parallel beta-helix repeat protein
MYKYFIMEKILKGTIWIIWLSMWGCSDRDGVLPKEGMSIVKSTTIQSGVYVMEGGETLDQPIIIIEGEDIVVDFNGATLVGNTEETHPDQFKGLGILVRNGKNITLKNLKIKGYKVGLMVENVTGFMLEDSDLSYNYRQKLGSYREREDYADWLSYHQNEEDEWLRYGAGVYLKGVDSATVRGVTITGGQNGIMMTQTNHSEFYNNTIAFNSGIGIGLYRSSWNRVMHNILDWNVRGYSHGFYSRGQDSAGILCYEQSNENVFAYNSATHSGDGFFLWAGQSTMDSGLGGCNGNLLWENDFSYSPTNGIEVTFSSNIVVGNKMKECRYGIWGGYSFDSKIVGNEIMDSDYGIAIEHGHDHLIRGNYLENNKVGVRLWERAAQPQDWGFAMNNDVRSRGYEISENYFKGHHQILEVQATSDLALGPANYFEAYGKIVDQKGTPSRVHEFENYKEAGLRTAPPFSRRDYMAEMESPEPMEGALLAIGNYEQWAGREYIIMGTYGPYDFRSPKAVLREIEGDRYVFLLTGPEGNWKLSGGEGFEEPNSKTGTLPATFTVRRTEEKGPFRVELTYIGKGGMDEFGRIIEKGEVYTFGYEDVKVEVDWELMWKNTDLNPEEYQGEWDVLWRQSGQAVTGKVEHDMAFAWWDAPAEGIRRDGFLTRAVGRLEVEEGAYQMLVTSDDGVVVLVDGMEVLKHWDVHEPERDEILLSLGGKHLIEVYHFDKSGFSTLDVRLQAVTQ